MDLTIDQLSDAMIEQLRDEAGAHGDLEQVKICERALAGSKRARRECLKVINAARAMVPWWKIVSRAGVDYGIYPGETAREAFEAMVRDAGGQYGDEQSGIESDWIITRAA